MFFLYIILIIFVLSIIIIRFAEIEIHIKNLKYSSKKTQEGHINKDCKIIINIKVLDKINILKVDLTRIRK